ncbi:transposase family protein [Streptomyces sp. NPDC002287]
MRITGAAPFCSGQATERTGVEAAGAATTISDGQGRLLWSGADRPGCMHDQTAMRTEGIAEQFRLHPKVTAEVDEGYRGLANEFPDQISAPPKKPKGDAPLGEQYAWREMRRRQSSERICVEHANAEVRQWRPLQRYTGPREDYAATHQAIASLVSDGSARRPTAASRAPSSCSPGRPPADQPPADPPDQHAQTSIADQVVRSRCSIDLGGREFEFVDSVG